MRNICAIIVCVLLYAQPAIAHASVSSLLSSSENFISSSVRVVGTDIRAAKVDALIHDSAANVSSILRNYSSYKEFIPFFTRSRVTSLTNDITVLEMGASILKGTVDIIASVSIRETKLAGGITKFTLSLNRGDVDQLNALWTVYPVTESMSILTFRLMIDPGLWFVRDKTISRYNQVNARRTIRSIRKRLTVKASK